MRRKKNRDINIFTASAIDLFASSLGVFILIVMILLPNFTLEEVIGKDKIVRLEKEIKELRSTIKEYKEKIVELDKIPKQDPTVEASVKTQLLEIKELRKKVVKNKQLEAKVTELNEEIEQSRKRITELESSVTAKESSKKIIENKIKEIKKLRKKLIDSESKVSKFQTQAIDSESKNEKIEKLNKQIVNLQNTVTNIESERDQQNTQIDNLKNTISQMNKAIEEKKSDKRDLFAAVIVKWDTAKHDIDLVIKDPNGKEFNFKKKGYKGYPGEFSLDTRQGPGIEVWQTEKIIPGTYDVSIQFYNQYGNKSPASVNMIVFTVKGKTQTPSFKMDIKNSTRKKKFKLKIDEDGNANIL